MEPIEITIRLTTEQQYWEFYLRLKAHHKLLKEFNSNYDLSKYAERPFIDLYKDLRLAFRLNTYPCSATIILTELWELQDLQLRIEPSLLDILDITRTRNTKGCLTGERASVLNGITAFRHKIRTILGQQSLVYSC